MKRKKYLFNKHNIFSTLLKILTAVLLLLILICVIKTCQDCKSYHNHTAIIEKTGYLPEDENWDNIPDVDPPYDEDDLDSLAPAVLLEQFFPPIGNQGDKGTCVAWAVGYNLKTALNAIEHKWTKKQLDSSAYQTSPKDLWLCIPRGTRGENCLGTCFEPAFSALMKYGVASMKDVPYQNLGNCNGNKVGDASNKIVSFNRISSETGKPEADYIKAYLNDTIPLAIGTRLGDSFMNWHSDGVLSSDTYNYNGMHANHAMVVTGYDDGKKAFRVRNSWGAEWGDKGSIWIDYDFFCNEFCYVVFVAQNKSSQVVAQNVVSNNKKHNNNKK